MNIGFLITARLKSSRLKRKLLLPLNGHMVIERVIQRAKAVIDNGEVILCTSTLGQDRPLVDIAARHGIHCFTGHPEDVLQRLQDACTRFGLGFFVGITADNPLFSIEHARRLADMVRQDPEIDFVYTMGMPVGIDIYAMKVKALRTVCAVKEQVDTEIWGYLINQPGVFNVREIPAEPQYIRSDYRLTLDEQDDYRLFQAIYDHFNPDDVVDVLSVYAFLDTRPHIAALNRHVVQRDLDLATIESIDEYYRKNRNWILKIKQDIYHRTG